MASHILNMCPSTELQSQIPKGALILRVTNLQAVDELVPRLSSPLSKLGLKWAMELTVSLGVLF